jgi:hypothetical protein
MKKYLWNFLVYFDSEIENTNICYFPEKLLTNDTSLFY